MRRKVNRTKLKSRLRSAKHNGTFRFTFIRYSLSLVAVAVLVSLIYPLIAKRQVPCANTLSCEDSLKLKVENNAVGIFNNQKVAVPNIALGPNDTQPAVLGIKSTELSEKHIYVNLKTQILTAYDGGELFMQTPISSGKWFPTPTGEFTIWVKLRSTRMSGGQGADYYNLPNVPYVMFYSNNEVPASSGFSLHGTYWHNNFGHPMSHGCVNMKTSDIAKLYEWVTLEGTKITIFNGE